MIYRKVFGKSEKGSVIVVHGLGEHSGRYEKLREKLVNNGFKVVLFDLPGHGESSGIRGHFTFKQVFEIIDEYVDENEPSILFGHSLGGLITIRYAEKFPGKLKGLVLSSPALSLSRNVSLPLVLIVNLISFFVPVLQLDNGINPEDISRSKDAVKKYISDPKVHRKISAKLAVEMIREMKKALEEANRIDCPVLLIIGTEDKITPPQGAKRFFEDLRVNKKILEYKGAYHEIFEDPKYEESLYEDILSWLEKISRKV
ncbi:MAG TPA: alpha/beta hydrolase [Thermotoga sp.]|nr:alpha/beta hydrolase [Thermotoga sp.]